jgi:hypothetical protein
VSPSTALLDSLTSVFKRFVILPPWAAETLALWTVHTYCFEFRDVTTYLGLESPEKRCGKTTLLTVLSELVQRPIVAANISSSALFRVIEETRPTLLIDEADSFLKTNDELRGILNSGYTRKTAYVVRVTHQRKRNLEYQNPKPETNGGGTLITANETLIRRESCSEAYETKVTAASPEKDSSRRPLHDGSQPTSAFSGEHSALCTPNSALLARPSAFPQNSQPSTLNTQHSTRLAHFTTWCPKVMAAIGRLPDTLADRCIVIRMQRKTAKETCERLRNLDANGLADDLRRRCAQFALENQAAIATATPAIPPDLNDRAADIWEPLFAIADLAGEQWPKVARDAAVNLTVTAQGASPATVFLMDVWISLKVLEKERVFSRELVRRLNRLPERPWADSNQGKKPLTELELASRLRGYGVRPKTMWIEGVAGKGYEAAEVMEVIQRYVPTRKGEESER